MLFSLSKVAGLAAVAAQHRPTLQIVGRLIARLDGWSPPDVGEGDGENPEAFEDFLDVLMLEADWGASP